MILQQKNRLRTGFLLSLIAILVTAFSQNTFAQESTQPFQLSQLLTQYYQLKDALVAGNGNQASVKANEFIKIANSIDYKIISEGNINALLKDASPISETNDLNIQRRHFANLSDNLAILAKSVKLGPGAIYLQHCPMKKANWLSHEKEIKNPYYGNDMLTCGKVVETINQ